MPTGWRPMRIPTARGSFAVFCKGQGRPLAVTHLYSEYNESGDHFADVVADFGQVYLINLRDAGESPAPSGADDLGIATAIKDLESIRMALGLPTWVFGGHSTGGMLGLCYGAEHSPRLSGLIVVGTAASRDYVSEPGCIYNRAHPAYSVMQDLIERLKDPTLSPSTRKELTALRTQLSLWHPERYERYFGHEVSKRIAVPRLNHFAQVDFPQYDLTHRLADIATETLVLAGRHDVQCPVTCSYAIHERLPRSQLVIFDHSNHYPFVEEREPFRATVAAYLAGLP